LAGKPSSLFARTDPDWAPSLNLGYASKVNPRERAARFELFKPCYI